MGVRFEPSLLPVHVHCFSLGPDQELLKLGTEECHGIRILR